MPEGAAQPSAPRKSIDEILANAIALRKSTSQVTQALRGSVSQAQAGLERVQNRREYVESLKEADSIREERARALSDETSKKIVDLEDRWEAVHKRLLKAGEKLFAANGINNDGSVAEAGQVEADNTDKHARIVLTSEDIGRSWLQTWLGREISILWSTEAPLPESAYWKSLDDKEWRRFLSLREYSILRQKDTEEPNSEAFFDPSSAKETYLLGREDHEVLLAFPEAAKLSVEKTCRSRYYCCRGCQLPLYMEDSRFESSCGWPAFAACLFSSPVVPGEESSVKSHVAVQSDVDGERFEIVCNRCLSHLGHVFCNERFAGSERHCVNSRCLEVRDRKSVV